MTTIERRKTTCDFANDIVLAKYAYTLAEKYIQRGLSKHMQWWSRDKTTKKCDGLVCCFFHKAISGKSYFGDMHCHVALSPTRLHML